MNMNRQTNPLRELWKFSRPHTIIGTTLSLSGLYTLALIHAADTAATADLNLPAALWAWISCIGANIYIVGLNQITDVEIDRINKPDLPLASGAFSLRTGWLIITAAVVISLLMAVWQGGWLLLTVITSLLIGTIYSLPPIRLKRFHFWAAACIFTVRGVIVNLFLFLHFDQFLTGTADIPPQVWALLIFIFGFSLVIAWFKDIPDMSGDDEHKIVTLSLKLGPRTVFNLGRGVLAACYLGLILAGWLGLPGVNPVVLTAVHGSLLILMWARSRTVDPTDSEQFTRYYLFTWVLFFLEYLLYPLTTL